MGGLEEKKNRVGVRDIVRGREKKREEEGSVGSRYMSIAKPSAADGANVAVYSGRRIHATHMYTYNIRIRIRHRTSAVYSRFLDNIQQLPN